MALYCRRRRLADFFFFSQAFPKQSHDDGVDHDCVLIITQKGVIIDPYPILMRKTSMKFKKTEVNLCVSYPLCTFLCTVHLFPEPMLTHVLRQKL